MTENEKLDLILSEVRDVKGDVQELKEDMQEVKGDVQVLKEDVQNLKEDVQELKEDMQEVKGDVQVLEQGAGNLNRKVTDIGLHLENVTDKNIQTVAEGHLDIMRKLNEALKVENEKEIMLIRVRILEDELRKVKERFEETA